MSLSNPVKLAGDLALDMAIGADGQITALAPGIGVVWVSDHGFLAKDPNSTFICGGMLDFLSYVYGYAIKGQGGLESYRTAVEMFVSLYGDRVPNGVDAATRERMVTTARQRRLIFNSIMFPLRAGMAAGPQKLTYEQSLTAHNIDPVLLKKFVRVLEKDDLELLKKRCSDLDINVEIPKTAAVIAYPFFRDFGTLSSAELRFGVDGKYSTHVEFFPSRIEFNGLLAVTPKDRIYVSSEPKIATAATHTFMKAERDSVCLAVRANLAHQTLGWHPKKATYLVRTGETDFRKAAVLTREGVDVRILKVSTTPDIYLDHTVCWGPFIVDAVFDEIMETGSISPTAKLTLESCHLSSEDKLNLINRLRMKSKSAVADVIDQMFHDGIIMENNTVRIYKTNSGYKYHRQSAMDGPMEDLSNFTMELVSNAVFPEENNVYHRAVITLNGNKFDYVIKHDDLETAKKLDKAVKTAEMMVFAGQQQNRVTPVITDLPMARFLIPYYRDITSKLPTEEGISAIGWNGMRNTFNAPTFKAYLNNGEVDISTSSRVRHPGMSVFNNYNFSRPKLDGPVTAPNGPLSDVVSQICAMVGRSYHGYPVKPVAIRNTPAASAALKRIFSELGQHQVLELNTNQRVSQDIPGIKGFPVLAMGYNAQQARSSRLPLFLLGDFGITIPDDCCKDADVDAAALCAVTAVEKVVVHMLKTSGNTYNRVNSLSYENELVREGASILCSAAEIDKWLIGVTPFEAVEKVLRAIPPVEVRKYFSHDLGKQTVHFHLNKLVNKADKQDILLELSTLVNSMQEKDGCLIMDAVSALDILQNFYHQPVQLEPINLPAV